MTRQARILGTAALAAAAVAAALFVPALADGPVPREFEGRIESIDAATGAMTVVRAHGGRQTRLPLLANPAPEVFDCDSHPAGRSSVVRGLNVNVFYENAGSRAIASLVVVERK